MTEKEIEEKANEISKNKKDRLQFCKDVGITEDEFFIKQNGDFEIEDILRAYNKANEWHKVKDEGLPKNNNNGATYLLYTIYGPGGSPVVAHFKERDSQLLMNTWTGAILTEDKIVSWKEIELPTE